MSGLIAGYLAVNPLRVMWKIGSVVHSSQRESTTWRILADDLAHLAGADTHDFPYR